MRRLPGTLTLLKDTRENRDTPFPLVLHWWDERHIQRRVKIKTKRVALATGDFAFQGFEKIVLVERKWDFDELRKNFTTNDYRRENAKWLRMRDETKFPTLFLEARIGELYNPRRYDREPKRTLDIVLRKLAEHQMHLLWCPPVGQRRRLFPGELILRWMWQCIYQTVWLGEKFNV